MASWSARIWCANTPANTQSPPTWWSFYWTAIAPAANPGLGNAEQMLRQEIAHLLATVAGAGLERCAHRLRLRPRLPRSRRGSPASRGLQDRIDSGELFFWEPDEACAFEAQVRAYGAVKGKKKLPWRYRWPDDVRDDVLARLLALNAERYGEEEALGLHSKGGKQAVKASKAVGGSAPGGKRRGRPPKASQVGETGDDHSEQMGLGL